MTNVLSIEYRPLTCRSYDCRIFPAAGIVAGDENKNLITQRIRRWKFSYPTKRDRDEHSAVRSAALFLRKHAQCFPGGVVPSNSANLASLAIKVYNDFLENNDKSHKGRRVSRNLEIAKAVMEANEKFETKYNTSKV
jgi:hypothetical protein